MIELILFIVLAPVIIGFSLIALSYLYMAVIWALCFLIAPIHTYRELVKNERLKVSERNKQG